MTEISGKKTPPLERASTQTVGFRLSPSIARAVKVEAARRRVKLNVLFVEMWELYREKKRGS